MRKILQLTLLLLLVSTLGCSRKGKDIPPPRLGDLEVQFKVTDPYNRLGNYLPIPVNIAIYDDSLHACEIRSQRVTTNPDEVQLVEFKDIEARTSYYYLEIKIDYHSALDASCNDYMVFIEEGKVRRIGLIVMEYNYQGVDCTP
ncbi:MAG: hypothetical protein KAT58_08310 [candidate division Zixibacteria bacterium]|nr:hypothetical protein [candidate division Zixibacteria bacterium]